METVENRKRFTHRSHSLRSPSFSSPAFSLYKEKCSFLSRKRTVAVMNRGQRVNMAKKSKRHTVGFILKKNRSMTKKKPSTTPLKWCWALSDYSDFQRVKQCSACKQLFRILLFGAEMYCFAKSYAQKRTAYTLSCFAF